MEAFKAIQAMYELFSKVRDEDPKFDYKRFQNDMDRFFLECTIREKEGNKSHAASALGVQRTMLVERCRKHGLFLWDQSCRGEKGWNGV